MKYFSLLGILFQAVLGARAVSAQTFIPHPPSPPKYVVLDTRRLTTVKQELTLIAMEGYRARYVAPRPGGEIWPAGMTIILEKLPEGAAAPEYLLAEEKNGSAIHHLLEGALIGFRYVRNSAFVHKGHDFWADFWASAVWGEKHVRHEKYDTFTNYILLERTKDTLSCRYRAQLTDPGKENRLPKHHFAEGFRLVGEIENSLVLENCGDPAPGAEQTEADFAEADATKRYLVVSTSDFKRKQKELTEAVSRGFEISHASGNLICLLKNDSHDSPGGYAPLAAKTEAELERKMNDASGFRMIPESLARRSSVWSGVEYQVVMEKAPASGLDYRYRVLREKKGSDLEYLLNLLSAKGYEVKGMSRDGMGITVLMEKMIEKEAPMVPAEGTKPND